MKKITLQDIADAAEVSKATVSMILNRRGINNFNKDTVKKVLDIAVDYNYKSMRGKNFQLGSAPNHMIMVIVPSLFNPYYAKLLQGIEKTALMNGYQTCIRTTYGDAEREQEYLQQAARNDLCGVILCMPPKNITNLYALNRRLPVVVINDKKSDLQLPTIDLDNYGNGQTLARHLEERGHKHIVFISTALNDNYLVGMRRCQGVQDYCDASGMKLHVLEHSMEPNVEMDYLNAGYLTGYDLTMQALDEFPQATAIIAVNDVVALGVTSALHERGVKVPQEISVCAFDNVQPVTLSGRGLTSVDNALFDCGAEAFNSLVKQRRAYEETGDFCTFAHVEFKGLLVERNSTALARDYHVSAQEQHPNRARKRPMESLKRSFGMLTMDPFLGLEG